MANAVINHQTLCTDIIDTLKELGYYLSNTERELVARRIAAALAEVIAPPDLSGWIGKTVEVSNREKTQTIGIGVCARVICDQAGNHSVLKVVCRGGLGSFHRRPDQLTLCSDEGAK